MDPKTKSSSRPLLYKTLVRFGGKKFLSKKLRAKGTLLYTKDIFGTHAFWNRDGELLKASLLARELSLRDDMCSFKDEYDRLKSIEMLQWPSYKEEESTINRLLQVIRRSLDAYKHRRLKTRLFYLCPVPPNRSGAHFMLRSPLYRKPLKEALKKRRRDIKRERKIILTAYKDDTKASNASTTSADVVKTTTLLQKVCTNESLLLYTVASIFVGCVIVLIP